MNEANLTDIQNAQENADLNDQQDETLPVPADMNDQSNQEISPVAEESIADGYKPEDTIAFPPEEESTFAEKNDAPDVEVVITGIDADASDTTQTQTTVSLEEYQDSENNCHSLLFPAVAFFSGVFLCGILLSVLCRHKKTRKVGNWKVRGIAVQGKGSRQDQQDALFLSDTRLYKKQGVVMCIADGMGGLSNGCMYSSVAVSAAANSVEAEGISDPAAFVAFAVRNATMDVNRIISPNFSSGGTTFIVAVLQKDQLYYASVGDSRICLCRDGMLHRLNRLHTYRDELLLGFINRKIEYVDMLGYENGEALTSYLGMGNLKYVDMPEHPVKLRRGDRVILMSDGVCNALSDEEISSVLSHGHEFIEKKLAACIERKKIKHQDNFSAVVVAID